MMSGPNSTLWFAHHELRLAWRDGLSMLRGGRKRGRVWMVVAIGLFELIMHLVAYGALSPSQSTLLVPDKAALLAATGSAFLTWTLLLSQAMETATRILYARADLDLILASPAPARRLFAVRIAAIAVSAIVMAVLVIGPFIDVIALLAGPRYLCAYGVLAAMGMLAAATAVGLTMLLFRLFGAKRTRFLAQVVAAIIGAGFVIGVQAAAILSYGNMSRVSMFQSPQWVAAAPGSDSPIWLAARAGMGQGNAPALVLAGAALFLCLAIVVGAAAFPRLALTVASGTHEVAVAARRSIAFGTGSAAHVLRRKEWTLLRRDPWLVSQSLMQVLYLVPPALMLWRELGTGVDRLVVLVPVLVMAAGQLGGGLAWLALSGEDAPDLVATAPVRPADVLRAKIEAVMVAVILPLLPFALAMAWASPMIAATMLVGGCLAGAGASAVQLIFRSKAKRSGFRRRQTSSRIATFAEAFLSISVAAAAGLAASMSWYALGPLAVAALVLVVCKAVADPIEAAQPAR